FMREVAKEMLKPNICNVSVLTNRGSGRGRPGRASPSRRDDGADRDPCLQARPPRKSHRAVPRPVPTPGPIRACPRGRRRTWLRPGDRMTTLRLSGLTRFFDGTLAVDNIDLDVAHGEFLTLLGPSGCGKTTTL